VKQIVRLSGLDGVSQFLNKAADTLQQVDSLLAPGISGS
jgi:hypothetical protein